VDRIEKDGIYDMGEDPGITLRPFFEEIFDDCGAVRPASA